MIDIELTEGEWVESLSPTQARLLKAILASGKTEEQAAEEWLGMAGAGTTSGFGGSGASGSFFQNLKGEFIALLCGSAKYEDERRKLKEAWDRLGKPGLISAATLAIAGTAGVAPAAATPVVALLLSIVSKVSINAFCTSCGVSGEAGSDGG